MGNQISVGPYGDPILTADDEDLRSIQLVTGVDVVGAELTIDQLTGVLDDPFSDGDVEYIAPNDYDRIQTSDDYVIITNWEHSDLREAPYGTPMRYYRDGNLVYKAYVQSVDRLGQTTYQVNGMSAIGLFDTQMHKGGVYAGTAFTTVLADIIGNEVDYTVDPALSSLQVFGWLPYDTKRNNLHKLLFAFGVMCGRDANGDMLFKFLDNTSSTNVPEERVYGGGSVDYSAPASSVEVTEHAFFALNTDETVVEYDNTDGSETADNTLVVFQNAPLHDLSVTGTLTINSSGVNWAVVSGTGVLSGKKYTHSTKVLTKTAEDAPDQLDNIVSVTSCTLVTVTNSENVADRILSYYSSKKTVNAGLVIENEHAGDLITAQDPYNEPISGYISVMDTTVSSILRGDCKIITDYTPTGSGNNFTSSHLYTGSGTVDLTTLVAGKDNDLIQVILISGGHGGYPGANGSAGTAGGQGSSPNYGTPGDGGIGGLAGEGAKVFVKTVRVNTLVQTTVSYSCGSGGLSGQDGGDTTLGLWSSADGSVTANGVADIFTGTAYAYAGAENGQDGGSGSGPNQTGTNVIYGDDTWVPGSHGRSSTSGEYVATGGWGGGPAVGSDGGDGEDSIDGSYGDGGDGADGNAGADATQYGVGGNGGHGGGGAGVGGARQSVGPWWFSGPNGTPGQGGAGGQGGPGLIIIYA